MDIAYKAKAKLQSGITMSMFPQYCFLYVPEASFFLLCSYKAEVNTNFKFSKMGRKVLSKGES